MKIDGGKEAGDGRRRKAEFWLSQERDVEKRSRKKEKGRG